MNAKMKIALVLVAALVAGNAQAAGAFEIRGVAIGDTKDALLAMHPDAHCTATKWVLADEGCSVRGPDDIYGAYGATPMYYLVGGSVERIAIMFTSDDFNVVLAAMRLRHGKPTSFYDGVFTDDTGTEFQNRIATWIAAGKQSLEVKERYGSLAEQSAITLTSWRGEVALNDRKGTWDRAAARAARAARRAR